MDKTKLINDLVNLLDNSPTAYQAVDQLANRLASNNFTQIKLEEKWKLEAGKSYYLINNDSSIIAFKLPNNFDHLHFHIVGSHSDSPCFKLKPKAIVKDRYGYIKLSTEVYGGPIFSTWLDRPLSIAGRVYLKGDSFEPKMVLFNIDKNLLIIPNLAIHQNREINKGYEYNPQVDMQALVGITQKDLGGDATKQLIAKELNCKIEDILDFDLYLYTREKAEILGYNDEFISSARLDNLAMAHSSITALIDANPSVCAMAVVTDNEEVGSMTRQGADSPFIRDVLERILYSIGKSDDFHEIVANSFLISADMAHAVHPNKPEKSDPDNFPKINQGPVIKYAANKAYTSDGLSGAIFRSFADKAGVPVQGFTNRSDVRGGSTIGPITASHINIKSIDVGNPTLSMHSIRELQGVDDHEYIYKIFLEFYK